MVEGSESGFCVRAQTIIIHNYWAPIISTLSLCNGKWVGDMNIYFTAQYIPITFETKIGTMFLVLSKPFFRQMALSKGKRKTHLMFSIYHLCQLLQPISWICFGARCFVTSIFWQSFLFEKCSSVLEGEDYLQFWKFCWNFLTLLQELQRGKFHVYDISHFFTLKEDIFNFYFQQT